MTTQTLPLPGTNYTPERRWDARAAELATFLTVQHRLPVRAERISQQGSEHSLASWLHVQQIAYRRGELIAHRRHVLERLHPMSLGLIPAPLIRPMPKADPAVPVKGKKSPRARTTSRESRTVRQGRVEPRHQVRRRAEGPLTPSDRAWVAKLERAAKTLAAGRPDSASDDPECAAASKWLSAQRVQNQRNPYAPWRIQMFEAHFPGKLTTPPRRKTPWEQSFAELETFLKVHDKMPSSASTGPEKRLVTWLRSQERRIKKGTLSASDRARLDVLVPGWTK